MQASLRAKSRPEPLFLDIPDEIFRRSPPLVATMPEHLNPSVERHEETVSRLRLLLYGCSLTTQYGASLATHLDKSVPVEVWMCGLCGRTAAELARMAERPFIEDEASRVGKGIQVILAEQDPFDVVLILAGTNDLGMGYESEIVVESIKKLHHTCHERGIRTVALSLPPNVACERSPAYKEKWRTVNRALLDWSRDWRDRVALFVDTSEMVPLDAEGVYYNIDRLHFSAQGAERFGIELAHLLGPILSAIQVPLLASPSLHQEEGFQKGRERQENHSP